MTTIDLDALVNPARLPKVRLFGREMTVHPLTGAAAHRIAVVQQDDPSGAGMLAGMLDVVATIVPDLSADERARLTVDQLLAVLQLARGQVSEVEQQIADAAAKN
jgi:hypothetical protein